MLIGVMGNKGELGARGCIWYVCVCVISPGVVGRDRSTKNECKISGV